MTYLVISKSKKAPYFFSYVLIRWLRLVPSVVAILCLTILLQKFGKGPLFHEQLTEPYVKPCYDYWWTHVLFINNFWTLDKMVRLISTLILFHLPLLRSSVLQCGPNLWFIAADLQLHVLLYVVIFLYFRKKFLAYFVSIILIVCSLGSFFLFHFLTHS